MTSDQADSKQCPFCKETIRREAIKCRFCGEFLEAAPTDAPPLEKAAAVLPMADPQREPARYMVDKLLLWLVLIPLVCILLYVLAR